MTDDQGASAKPAAGATAAKSGDGKGCGCAAAAAVFLLLMGGAAMCNSSDDDGPKSPTVAEKTQLAKDTCQDAVKKQLKAPSSARFSEERAVAAGSEEWTVSGAVDSQNGFGAMLRAQYTCTARFDGTTMRARVVSLG